MANHGLDRTNGAILPILFKFAEDFF